MSYLYFANLDPSDRLNQLEIQLDNGTTAILRLGHSYDLTANELARARRYAVLTSTVETSITSMRASYFVNARDGYGWIGDGTYHPLSENFTTLAAAQVTYPHATALTDATDWAALQGAMNAAATKGQAVYADGTGISDKGFTHPSHVHVWGPGGMTNLFASTDASFKQTAGLTIRLKAGVTVDALWKSANYDTITGTASPNVYTALPWHMGLHYLKLDGNSTAARRAPSRRSTATASARTTSTTSTASAAAWSARSRRAATTWSGSPRTSTSPGAAARA
jgi:hypothetical protein